MTTMKAPQPFFRYNARSGSSYLSDTNSIVNNVLQQDVVDLINMGFIFQNGLAARAIALLTARNADGSSIAAGIPALGNFVSSVTAGVITFLKGATAILGTASSTVMFEIALTSDYIAGTNLTLTVNAKYAGTGTVGASKSVNVAAYETQIDGTQSANLVSTGAQTLTTTSADYPFVINGALLKPGDRVMIAVTTAVNETGGLSTLNAQVNSVRFA